MGKVNPWASVVFGFGSRGCIGKTRTRESNSIDIIDNHANSLTAKVMEIQDARPQK